MKLEISQIRTEVPGSHSEFGVFIYLLRCISCCVTVV